MIRKNGQKVWRHLILQPAESCPDSQMFQLSLPVHLLLVAAWLAQSLVQAPLQLLWERICPILQPKLNCMSNLYPHHHVDMPLGVLLYHVTHIVRLLGLAQVGSS